MRYSLGLALVIVGVVLLAMGFHSADSIGSSFSRLFTGAPTDKAIGLLIGGTISAVVGAGLMSPIGRNKSL